MKPLVPVHRSALPPGAALAAYARDGAYTDCYAVVVPRVVTQAEYVEAFYTTAVFKVERWLIARFLSRPSTDAQALQLAQGQLGSFAAWSVEPCTPDQLVLAAGRTRSWLMACASDESGQPGTKLYFGSAVVARRGGGSGRSGMGWPFRALLGFHKLYSRVLLDAAMKRLGAQA
jgi:hypothetical protein